jgi:hypothetical protein
VKKLILALLLVAVLLSLFAGVVSATCPEYEDPLPPGFSHANPNGQAHMRCLKVPVNAAENGGFMFNSACPAP